MKNCKKEIENIIGYWIENRKNVMDFNLLEEGIQNLLDKQRNEIKEKIKEIKEQAEKYPIKIYGNPDTRNECEGFSRGYNGALSDTLKEIEELNK